MRIKTKWWNVQRAAAFLGISERTLRYMLANGVIRRRRAGRAPIYCYDLEGLQRRVTVTREAIDNYLEALP